MPRRPIVLIIETRQNTRTLLEMTLSSERMRVFSAVSLSSALLQLRVLQPDLIIIGNGHVDHDVSTLVAQIKALSSVPLLLLAECEPAATAPPGIASILGYPLDAKELCAKVAWSLAGGATDPAPLSDT